MANLFSGGLVAAMEDETNAEAIVMDEAPGSESMEADLVEAVDLGADVEAGADEMESTIADADQLERHVEVLTDAEQEGGASPELVEATEIAVEGICRRLGIHSGSGIPALEGFSTSSGRARNTRVAIESITDKIKQIWNAVKMAFQKLINYVKDFFAKLFDANAKMLGRVNSLRAKLKNLKGTPGKTVKGSGISDVIPKSALTNAKKGAGAGGIKNAIGQVQSVAGLLTTLADGVVSQQAYDAVTTKTNGKAVQGMTAPDGFQWSEYQLIGNSVIALLESKTVVKGKQAYEAFAKASAKVQKAEKAGGDGELPVLDASSMEAVLSGVEDSVRELMGQKAQIASINADIEKTTASIAKIVSAASKDDEGMSERSTKGRSAVSAVGNSTAKLVTLIGSETTRVCQAYLTYVERSIGSYSEDKKEEKK